MPRWDERRIGGLTLAQAIAGVIAASQVDDEPAQYDPTVYGTVIESWDFTRSDTLFQDSAGTTPAGVGDPVGRYLSPFTEIPYTRTTTTAKPARTEDGLSFDGVDDALLADAALTFSGSVTLIADVNDTAGAANALRYLLDIFVNASVNRLVFATDFSSNLTIAVYSSSWRQYGTPAITGRQTLTFVINTGASTTQLRRDSQQLSSVAINSQTFSTANVGVGGRWDTGQTAGYFEGTIRRMTLYAGVLSGQNLIDAEAAIAS